MFGFNIQNNDEVIITPWEYVVIGILCVIAGISIIETAYLGINGHHTFRQADSYGYILGALELRNFDLFDLFSARAPWGERAVFDLPIYEYSIALLSSFLDKDPLVAARYFNLILWVITAFFGYRITTVIANQFAGLSFVALFATSPLFLHYFSSILPDNLAIAFSMVATALLVKENRNWKTFVAALFFIVVASAVKSPVPFIFVVFSTCYITLSALQVKDKKGLMLLAIFLVGTLAVALFIEIYRGWLMSEVGSESGHLWGWYFGSWSLRASKEFWIVILARFNGWQPPYFFVIFGVIVTFFLTLDRNAKTSKVLISGILAFFAGWLVFSNVYKIHDYYQLPVALVVFISAAALVGSFIRMLEKRAVGGFTVPVTYAFRVILMVAFFYQMITVDSLSNKTRINFWNIVEYSLRQQEVFLLVANKTNNPAVGGYVGTKFVGITSTEFEGNCKEYLMQYGAVLFEGVDSACIESARLHSTYYIQDKNRMFIKLEK